MESQYIQLLYIANVFHLHDCTSGKGAVRSSATLNDFSVEHAQRSIAEQKEMLPIQPYRRPALLL